MEHEFQVVKLHDAPNLIEEAAQLINSEWPRSLEARCHAIRCSSDDLPCSFLLLKVLKGDNVQTVVGYSHLSKVLQKSESLLVESVIVDKSLRGCGLGKMIMKQTEEFALKNGYTTMHLSTHDKQSFYEHLGYSLSTPVSPETKVARFLSKSQIQKADLPVQHGKGSGINVMKVSSELQTGVMEKSFRYQTAPNLSIPLPPPPPIPNILQKTPVTKRMERGSKGLTWMEKNLNGSDNPP